MVIVVIMVVTVPAGSGRAAGSLWPPNPGPSEGNNGAGGSDGVITNDRCGV